MDRAELAERIERHARAQAAWQLAVALERTRLVGTVADEVLESNILLKLTEERPELYEEYVAASIAHEQGVAEIRLREVEAHERLALMRTAAELS